MTAPARTRLPSLSSGVAALLRRLAETLDNGRLYPSRRIAPAWVALEAEPGQWTVLIAPLAGADGPLRLTADGGEADALYSALALEAVEPIVAALESAWNVTLRPVHVTGDPPHGPVLEVEREQCTVLLSFGPDQSPSAEFAASRPHPERVSSLPVATECRIQGPALSLRRLNRLATGDLLLVSSEPRAELAAGASLWSGRADLKTRTFSIEETGSLHMSATDEGWAEARSPVQIVIDGGTVRVGELAALAPGSVLTLDLAGEVLPVELRAAGVRIGRGELVTVGNAFGVLMTSVHMESADRESSATASASPEAVEA